jgi:hypothetical protein
MMSPSRARGGVRALVLLVIALGAGLFLTAPAGAATYDAGTDAVVLGIVDAAADGTACITVTLPAGAAGEPVIATGVGTTDLTTVEATVTTNTDGTITACTEGFAPGSPVRFFVRVAAATATTTAPASSPGALARTGSNLATLSGVGAAALLIGVGLVVAGHRRRIL